ncbi:MAG: hypothetical protein WC959_07560 [Kiritimatiellales bacterium]
MITLLLILNTLMLVFLISPVLFFVLTGVTVFLFLILLLLALYEIGCSE